MSKRAKIVTVAFIVTMLIAAGAAYWVDTSPGGRLIASVKHGIHTVTVRQFRGRFHAEISEEGSYGSFPISSYEFYEGSDPITAATITWPESEKFTVSFNNRITLDCTWNQSRVEWTLH